MAKQQEPGNGHSEAERRQRAARRPPDNIRQLDNRRSPGRQPPQHNPSSEGKSSSGRPSAPERANSKRPASNRSSEMVRQQTAAGRPQGARVKYPVKRSPAVMPHKDEGGDRQNKKEGKTRRFYDYSLLFTIIFLTVFGLVMIYSSSSYSAQLRYHDAGYFMKRQGVIALGSFVLMLIVSKIDYHFYAKFVYLAYGASYLLMALAMWSPLGVEVNGKKRWLKLGPGIQIQPTELVKIALILLIAVVITQMGTKINEFSSLLKIAALALPLAVMVAMNNLSSGIIILGITFVMCFVASKLHWPFIVCTGAAAAVFAFAGPLATALEKIGLLQGYQLRRIHVWLDPEAFPQDGGYQVLQGLYAIGSGGLVGKGLGESIQKLGFVPEAQNDMVFSIICEELGIFGAISVILIFLFMIYRFMLIASNAPDLFGAMLVVGVMGHIGIQVILNIAVVTNTIPNTGITLPFISYGGTSVLFLMMEMGMVLSVSNRIKLQK